MSLVAIVTPYYRLELSQDELTSFHHLVHYLALYDKFLITPDTLVPEIKGFRVISFAADYFHSTQSYSRLLFSRSFYEAFRNYEYVLICQLDCLLLSGKLAEWCKTGFDYVGAPFIDSTRKVGPRLTHVGNGGLCLRNVEACLSVLTSRICPDLRVLWSRLMPDVSLLNLKKRIRVIREARRGVKWYTGQYSLNEDLFWSNRASLFDPSFNIAPVTSGLQFAFERSPKYCFEQNGYRLPFGAHAWTKWDRSFWEPYLLTE